MPLYSFDFKNPEKDSDWGLVDPVIRLNINPALTLENGFGFGLDVCNGEILAMR